uniref:Retrovirus-related Pol polyprotein from transposon TNT 1-94 n=1 Tax=Tanacetum cinerariifolium TaxID=118510 RepID=A0A6L2NFR4_TANCI|nr:retrovirus-related Pol polyprotein from transposon TNT 1-94 [Tanacetum cinerariifolium]
MQKNLALIAKYFKKIYKPTNNNLRTSSNSKNKNVDTTPRFKNDNQSGQFRNQRTVNVATVRENVGSKVVQQSGIQCFNCKEYGHFSKECIKPKRVKDFTYHKEKMLLCKQAKQDSVTDSKPVEQVQNNAKYNVFSNKLQHSEQSESVSNTCLVEMDDSNITPDSPDMCEDDIQNEQNDVESDGERVALVNLIANLKLDVDENKKIQKQLKKANTTLAQELKECKTILAETSKSPRESISVRDSCLVALQTKQAEFEKYKAINDRTVDYDKLERKLNEALGQIAHKDTVIREGLKTKAYELLVVKEKHDELMKQSLLTKSHYEGLVKQKMKVITDLKLRPYVVRQPNAQQIPKPSVLGKLTPLSDSLERRYFPRTRLVPKTNVLEGVTHKPNVSRPRLKRNQSIDKVLPNNSQVEVKKTQVEVHPRIPSVSNKMKSVTAYQDSLNSRTLNANAVCATCNKRLIDSNHFACVTKMLNDVHARTKKPTVVPIGTRKPKSQVNKSIATPNKKKVASKSTNKKPQSYFRVLINRVYYVEGLNHNLFSVGQFCDANLEVAFKKSTCFIRDLQGNDLLIDNRGSDLYIISLQKSTSSTPLCLMAKATPTQAWLWHRRLSHLNFDYINLLSKKDIVIALPKLKYVKDQLCSSYELSKAKRSSFKLKVVPSSKGRLNLLHMDLCGQMRVASINGKKYILVIVYDYSRYTWTLFLRSKDETPKVLKDFLTMI